MPLLDQDSPWWAELVRESLIEAERRVSAKRQRRILRRWQLAYRDDPAAFVRDCIDFGPKGSPVFYQLEGLRRLATNRRFALRGPHGLGKTAMAAWAVLWFALTRDGEDWKVPTTASAWRQLTKFLWPEIHLWARRLRWDRIPRPPFNRSRELLTLSLKLRTGEAFALASDNADLIEGAHATHLLYVFDEAKAIPRRTWDAAEGAMSSGNCYWLAISTPGEPQGVFYDIHARKPGFGDWSVMHVRKEDAIAAGRISRQWVEQRRSQWGENSAVYLNRVEGEFASSVRESVIPLAWVEVANERWLEWQERSGGEYDYLDAVGVDVARYGDDKSCLALRQGDVIVELRKFARVDTMELAGMVAGVLLSKKGTAIVDVIGIGAGVVDRLRERGLAVRPFNASESTSIIDRSGELGFADKRSAAWWNLRELLDPANNAQVALPPDDELLGDLTAPGWRVTSGGKIKVEEKEKIKRRLGRSTDVGDAVVQAFWQEPDIGGVGFVL